MKSIRPLSGVSCPPFYRPRGSRGYRWEKEEKTKGREGPSRVLGLPFSLKPALLTWQTTLGIACFIDPDRARLWLRLRESSCPILPQRTVRCVRAPSHDSTGSRRGNDYTPVTVDDVSSSLDCSGCRIPMLVSAPECSRRRLLHCGTKVGAYNTIRALLCRKGL